MRGWLAKALGASRGPQWICGNCSHIHAAWEPVCEACGAFDSLDWKEPAHPEDTGLADSALLPLIVGAEKEPAPPPPEVVEPGVEDAELATVADRARAAGGG